MPEIQCFRAPCTFGGSGGTMGETDGIDWGQLLMLGSNEVQEWWIMTHPGTQFPAPAPGGEIVVPGFARASFNTNLLIIGAVVVLALLLLNK